VERWRKSGRERGKEEKAEDNKSGDGEIGEWEGRKWRKWRKWVVEKRRAGMREKM